MTEQLQAPVPTIKLPSTRLYNGEVFTIDEICPHPGSHADEDLAIVFAKMYGGGSLVGVGVAPIVPRHLSGKSELEWLRERILPIGQCCGEFDDKLPDGTRRENTCTARRTAEIFGVQNNPEVVGALRAVQEVDEDDVDSPQNISRIIKYANDSTVLAEQAEVCLWGCSGFEALILNAKKSNSVADRLEILLGEAIAITDSPATKEKLRKQFGRDDLLEMDNVREAMESIGLPQEKIAEWVEKGIKYVAQQMDNYELALKEVIEKAKFHEIVAPWGNGRTFVFTVIHTDNPMAAQASRDTRLGKKRAHVTLVVRPTGEWAFLFRKGCGLNPMNLWALIRTLECPEHLRSKLVLRECMKIGIHPLAPGWFAMAKGGALLCGSKHIPATVKTSLNVKTVVKWMKFIFTSRGLEFFNDLTGSTLDAKQIAEAQKAAAVVIKDSDPLGSLGEAMDAAVEAKAA